MDSIPLDRARHEGERGEPIQPARNAAGERMQTGHGAGCEQGAVATGRSKLRGQVGFRLGPRQGLQPDPQRANAAREALQSEFACGDKQDRDHAVRKLTKMGEPFKFSGLTRFHQELTVLNDQNRLKTLLGKDPDASLQHVPAVREACRVLRLANAQSLGQASEQIGAVHRAVYHGHAPQRESAFRGPPAPAPATCPHRAVRSRPPAGLWPRSRKPGEPPPPHAPARAQKRCHDRETVSGSTRSGWSPRPDGLHAPSSLPPEALPPCQARRHADRVFSLRSDTMVLILWFLTEPPRVHPVLLP